MLYRVWDRRHPIDVQYGIDTIGMVEAASISSDKNLIPQITIYAGSQPSILRKSLAALGPVEEYTFIDYGCGKGRAAIVAAEFPFREVVGVDLSGALVECARENAAKVAARFPGCPQMRFEEANVVDFSLPPGKLVLFAYHPFGAEVLAQVVKNLEAALAGHTTHIFFVYDFPVHAAVLDASPGFRRFYAGQIPYDKSELGFGIFREDVVVIWQSVRGATATAHPGADRGVRVADGKADLVG
jgi:predicted RNA methylase